MFTNTTGLFIIPLWIAMMAWVVARDVWPAWTAEEPPRVTSAEWIDESDTRVQFAVSDDLGRIGTIWTRHLIDENSMQRFDTVFIDRFAVPGVAPLRITVDSTFNGDGLLDEFTVGLENRVVERMRLHGERFYADFSFTLSVGPEAREQAFKMPLAQGGLINGGFSPLARLTGLTVGRSWRMQVFNPIAALTGVGDRFLHVLVTVTRRDTLQTSEGEQHCFVLESPNTVAWVDDRGTVWRQEISLPIGGRIRIERENHFDQKAQADALKLGLYVTSANDHD